MKSVLFVDDHEVLARLSVDILEMNGYLADSALSVEDALRKVEHGKFDIIACDFRVGGNQLAARLRPLPVIMFSGYKPVECKDNVIASLSKEDLFPALLEKLKAHFQKIRRPGRPLMPGDKPKVKATSKMIEVIRRIPRGKVMTYGDVAYVAGFPLGARVVGCALNKWPDLPWERVVGAGGKIMRPGILGQEQRLRLQQQGVGFIGLKVDMKRFRCKFSEVGGNHERRNKKNG